MTKKQTNSEWTGTKGKIMAWYLNSPLRTLIEVWLLGNPRSAFLSEVSRRIRGNEVILDVGAGSGYFSLAIAKKLNGGKVICLDLSEEMLQHLERKAEKEGLKDRIQILMGEASSSGLGNEFVDLIVSNYLLHEVSSPEEVLKEMLRVLKPNGWIIITDFRDSWLGKCLNKAEGENVHGSFSINDIETLFAKSGLRDVKIIPVRHWVIGIGKK